jgi:hypothetical protein
MRRRYSITLLGAAAWVHEGYELGASLLALRIMTY